MTRCWGAFPKDCVTLALVFLFLIPVQACAETLTGAGSSFAAPLYAAWGASYHAVTKFELNYQSVGSGAGLNQAVAGTVDFGATDKPADLAFLSSHALYQFPTALGAVVVIVNVPVASPLQLDGPTLAGIYDGRITLWNDPQIQAQNPNITLPDMAIAPVHRADASGTTFVFTAYLSRMSPQWRASYGAGTSVAWTEGAGARGNDGVSATVRQTPGGIGYVEYAYAKNNHLPLARLKSHDGVYVEPDTQSFEAAVKQAEWRQGGADTVDLLDRPGAGAWPIMSATYVVVPRHANPLTRRFFEIGFSQGLQEMKKLDYIPLPSQVRQNILAQWPP